MRAGGEPAHAHKVVEQTTKRDYWWVKQGRKDEWERSPSTVAETQDAEMPETERPKEYFNRVLVVDDDYQLADLLREVLTYENCSVDVASNGMEAMGLLRSADYEAVVCDLMMPRMDGEALYNEVVKQFPYLSDRFLFMTSQAVSRAGFSDFVSRTGNTLLEKPIEVEQLRAAVGELFRR